jgi:hypothetical protein
MVTVDKCGTTGKKCTGGCFTDTIGSKEGCCSAQAFITVTGGHEGARVAASSNTFIVKDEEHNGETANPFQFAAGKGSASWSWSPGNADGMVLGPLPDAQFCVGLHWSVYNGIDSFKIKGGLKSTDPAFKFDSPASQIRQPRRPAAQANENNWKEQVKLEMTEPVVMGICCGADMGNTEKGTERWERLWKATEANAAQEKAAAPKMTQLASPDDTVLKKVTGYEASELPISPVMLAAITFLLGLLCCATAWVNLAPKDQRLGSSGEKGGYSSVPGGNHGGGGGGKGILGGYQQSPNADC